MSIKTSSVPSSSLFMALQLSAPARHISFKLGQDYDSWKGSYFPPIFVPDKHAHVSANTHFWT